MNLTSKQRACAVRCHSKAAASRTTWTTTTPLPLLAAVPVAMLLTSQPAFAEMNIVSAERSIETSPLVQKLLENTEKNREQRYKERLADYNRRNFRDYFDFEAGSISAAKARGISDETAAQIRQWLKDNQ